MKTLISKYWLVLMALVSVCMFTACSSDDDDAVAPVFPQVQKLAGEAGDELDFTFEANTNWSLASSAIWCKMEQGENTDAFVLNGQAGKQTIKVKLTDDDASKDLSVAQLVLTMGGQKAAIAEVTRSAAGYSVTVFDEEGNDITETGLVVGYDEYTKFSVQANYRFAVTNTPDWVELEGGFMVGRANENTQGGVMFKEGVKDARYAISTEEGYTITIASEDGKAVKTIPVRFNGMPTSTMDITYPTSSRWAVWNVSLDGKTFTQNGSSLMGDVTNEFTFNNFVPFTLKTFGDEYVPVVFEKVGGATLYEYGNSSVEFGGEQGDLKIKVSQLNPSFASSREVYVYALPKAVFDAMENPEEAMINRSMDDMTGMLVQEFNGDYDRYFLMHFIQQEPKKDDAGDDAAPIVINGATYATYTCTKDKDGMYNDYASAVGYAGSEVYYITANVGEYVIVNPNIKDWTPTDLSDIYTINSWAEEIEVEPGMDEQNNWTFGVSLDDKMPVVMGFKDGGEVVKVLVIDRNWDAQSKKYNSIKRIRK